MPSNTPSIPSIETAERLLDEFAAMVIETYLNKEPHVKRSFIVSVPGPSPGSKKEYTVYASDSIEAVRKVCLRHAASLDEAITMAASASADINMGRLRRTDTANEDDVMFER